MANFPLFGSASVYAGMIILTIASFDRPDTVQAVNVDKINRLESGEIPAKLEVAIDEMGEQNGYLNEAGPLFSQTIINTEHQLKKDKTFSKELPENQAEQRVRRTAECRGDTCDTSGGATRGGTIYTIWGKANCPSTTGTQLVYSGVVGGPSCSQKGGGGGYLCLPEQPDLVADTQQGWGWNRAHITNAEYKVSDFPSLSGKNRGNIPCAVCMIQQRGIQMMYPAKNDCPEGWTEEYHGFLMTAPNLSYRTDWICVDHEAEKGSTNSRNWGAALVPVEQSFRDSSSLPYTRYTSGGEFKCAVCTR